MLTLLDAIPAPRSYEVRTPRRGDRFAAQVWASSGFWALGLYQTRLDARRAAQVFAGSNPVEPARETNLAELPPNWVRRRRRYDDETPKWVRRVKGGAYQARYWLEVVGGSLNLGLF